MTGRRTPTRIIEELLAVSREGVSKTQAVYRTNLNFKLIEGYLNFLIGSGYLLRERSIREQFRLTVKGKHLLKMLEELEAQIAGFRVTP